MHKKFFNDFQKDANSPTLQIIHARFWLGQINLPKKLLWSLFYSIRPKFFKKLTLIGYKLETKLMNLNSY